MPAGYELNIRDYLRIFRKHRLLIITIFIVVVIGSIFYVSKQPVYYQASSTIKLEERKTIAGLLTESVMYNPGDVMESETRMITGYPVMKRAALKLGLITEMSSPATIDEAVSQVQGSISTERVGNTNMIRITATSDMAKRAMDIANTVANVCVEQNLQDKAKQARHMRLFIEEQLTSLEMRLRQSEEEVKKFDKDQHNLKLAVPIETKLADLQFKLAELSQVYTDQHPRIIQLKDEIRHLEDQIKGFSGNEVEYARIIREVEVNKKLYAMLKEKLEEARITEAEKVSDVSIVDPASMPGGPISGSKQIGVLLGIIMGLALGLFAAFIFETLDTSISTIEDVEKVLDLPVLGVVPPARREYARKTSFLESLRDRIFPSANEDEEQNIYLIAHYEPRSTIAEAYRNIQTNLKLSSEKKVILITSSGPREGKSSISSNLAIVMAQAGMKVMLIGADLRRPTLDRTFGIRRDPGLNELVTGAAKLKDVIHNIVDIMVGDIPFEDIRKNPGLENIWIIPSGRLPYNPAEILKSKAVEDMLEILRKKFDVIIFDAPPVLPVTDASILAPKMDSVIMVYETGRTSREALKRAKTQLESIGAKIAGVILNHTRPQAEAVVQYPYQKYHEYYGIGEKSRRLKRVSAPESRRTEPVRN